MYIFDLRDLHFANLDFVWPSAGHKYIFKRWGGVNYCNISFYKLLFDKNNVFLERFKPKYK